MEYEKELINFDEESMENEPRVRYVVLSTNDSRGGSAYASDPTNRSKTYLDAVKSDYALSKDDYRNLVILCRNIIKDEGLVRQFVELQQGLCALGMENKFKRDVNTRYRIAFNGFAARVNEKIPGKTRGLDEFQRRFCFEFWVSGMVCTLERRARMKMNRTISYDVPVELDILDPVKVNLDNIYSTKEVYYDIDDSIIKDIKDNGIKASFLSIYPDKVRPVKPTPDDPNPYQPKQKSDIVKLVVENGYDSVPLPMEKVRLYVRKFDDYSIYPIPYIASSLTSLADKAMLKEADRSIMSKLINMMLIYKIGRYNKEGQKVNAEDNIIRNAATNFGRNLQISKDGRVLAMFIPDTHDISWLIPNTDSLLENNKYQTADLGIVSSLYGVAGYQMISSSGNVDNELFFKIVRSQNELFLSIYKRFIEDIYYDIVQWNKMNFDPSSVNFKPKRLTQFDTKEFITMRANLTDKNQLSIRTTVEEAGEDFDAEIENLLEERDLREKEGILTVLPSFSQTVTKDTTNKTPAKNDTTTESQVSKGRPTGVVEKNARQTKTSE